MIPRSSCALQINKVVFCCIAALLPHFLFFLLLLSLLSSMLFKWETTELGKYLLRSSSIHKETNRTSRKERAPAPRAPPCLHAISWETASVILAPFADYAGNHGFCPGWIWRTNSTAEHKCRLGWIISKRFFTHRWNLKNIYNFLLLCSILDSFFTEIFLNK